jgi:hypothetical protein
MTFVAAEKSTFIVGNEYCASMYSHYYDETAGSALLPNIAFWNDYQTGIYQAEFLSGCIDFTSDGVHAASICEAGLTVVNDVMAGRVEAGIGNFYTNVTADKFVITDGRESLYWDVSFGWGSESNAPTHDNPIVYSGLFLKEQYTVGMASVETETQTWKYDGSAFAVPVGIVDGAEGAPSLHFNDDPTTGVYSSASDTLSITGGGNKALDINATSITTFVQTVARDAGEEGNPSYSFFNNLDSGLFEEGNAVKISEAGTIGLEVFNGYVHMPTILYMDYEYGDVETPSIAFWNDYQTGIYQAVDTSGAVDFSSNGVHSASIGGDGLTVPLDVMAGRVEAGVGSFYIDATSGRFFAGQTTQHLPKPQYSFVGDEDSGLAMNQNTANGVYLVAGGTWRQFWSTGNSQMNVPLRIDDDSTEGSPALGFRDDVTTGIFQIANGDGSIAFSTGGTQAGYFDAAQRLYITDVVRAGAGSEGVPTYTFHGDNNSGMYGPSANALAFVTGGADALVIDSGHNLHATNDIFGENDLHVANSLDAQIGFFYQSLHIGGHTPGGDADNDDMWKIYDDENNRLVITPGTPENLSGAHVGAPGRHTVIDSQLNLYPSLNSALGSSPGMLPVLNIKPDASIDIAIGSYTRFVGINVSPTISTLNPVPFCTTLASTQVITQHTGNASTSYMQTFLCSDQMNGTDAICSPAPMQSFVAMPIVRSSSGEVHDPRALNPAGRYLDWWCYVARPTFSTITTGTEAEMDGAGSILSQCMIQALTDTTATLNSYTDFRVQEPLLTQGGTMALELHDMISLEDDEVSDAVNGITSEITSGASKLFINHTGGADSVHFGDFYVRSMLSADTVRLTGGYVDGYVKPFVSLWKTDVQDIGGDDGEVNLVTWDVQDHIDTQFTHSTSVNPSRITINEGGRYSISSVVFGDNLGGNRITLIPGIKIDGGTTDYRGCVRSYSRGATWGDSLTPNVMTERQLTAGSYVEIEMLVDQADASYVVNTGDVDCEIIIRKIS